MEEFKKRKSARTSFVAPIEFGKDHWSVLLYLENRAVDGKGIIENVKMRPWPGMHVDLTTSAQLRISGDRKYPTRLAGGVLLPEHDDWSCAEDMEQKGYLEMRYRKKSSAPHDCTEAHVTITGRGFFLASLLRQHKAAGGTYAEFAPFAEPVK